MVTDESQVQSESNFVLPNAAILCLSVVVYLIFVGLGILIHRKWMHKKWCELCHRDISCNIGELGLRVAQTCSCLPPKPPLALLVDYCCPVQQECNWYSSMTSCLKQKCPSLMNCCPSSQAFLPAWNDCSINCSSIDCICCEISVKGRPS